MNVKFFTVAVLTSMTMTLGLSAPAAIASPDPIAVATISSATETGIASAEPESNVASILSESGGTDRASTATITSNTIIAKPGSRGTLVTKIQKRISVTEACKRKVGAKTVKIVKTVTVNKRRNGKIVKVRIKKVITKKVTTYKTIRCYGYYGTQTTARVKAVQRNLGMVPTGYVTRGTYNRIFGIKTDPAPKTAPKPTATPKPTLAPKQTSPAPSTSAPKTPSAPAKPPLAVPVDRWFSADENHKNNSAVAFPCVGVPNATSTTFDSVAVEACVAYYTNYERKWVGTIGTKKYAGASTNHALDHGRTEYLSAIKAGTPITAIPQGAGTGPVKKAADQWTKFLAGLKRSSLIYHLHPTEGEKDLFKQETGVDVPAELLRNAALQNADQNAGGFNSAVTMTNAQVALQFVSQMMDSYGHRRSQLNVLNKCSDYGMFGDATVNDHMTVSVSKDYTNSIYYYFATFETNEQSVCSYTDPSAPQAELPPLTGGWNS